MAFTWEMIKNCFYSSTWWMWSLNMLAWPWEEKHHWVPVCDAQLTMWPRAVPCSPPKLRVYHPAPGGAPHPEVMRTYKEPSKCLPSKTFIKRSQTSQTYGSGILTVNVSVRTGDPGGLSRLLAGWDWSAALPNTPFAWAVPGVQLTARSDLKVHVVQNQHLIGKENNKKGNSHLFVTLPRVVTD